MSSWSASSGLITGNVGSCQSNSLIGGSGLVNPGDYFTRSFTLLNSHKMIYFKFKLYAIDNWQTTDAIQISFDSSSLTFSGISSSSSTKNLCGGSAYDNSVYVTGAIAHTGLSLTIKIKSLLGGTANDRSFGFRELEMILNSTTVVSSKICAAANPDVAQSSQCCPTGYYLSGFKCSPCSSECSYCFDSTSSSCSACKAGYYYNGSHCLSCHSSCSSCSGPSSNQCLNCSSGNFLYWTNKCLANCPSPLTSLITNGILKCVYGCQSQEFLFLNGSCGINCQPPLTQILIESKNLCNYTCHVGSEFLLWNKTCNGSCIAPYVQKIESNYKFCYLPCPDGYFLYPDNSCRAECFYPRVSSVNDGINYCNFPCLDSQFFNTSDGSCLSSCISPRINKTIDTIKYCFNPCSGGKYLFQNNTCQDECQSPRISQTIEGFLFCNDPCPQNFYHPENGTCVSHCSFPYSAYVNDNIMNCPDPCPSSLHNYPNSSCINSCNPPWISVLDGTLNRCFKPCEAEKFLFENSSCLATCSYPFIRITVGDIDKCIKPCQAGTFLHNNGSCISSCLSPLIASSVDDIGICSDPCGQNEYYSINYGNCLTSCSLPMVIENIPFKSCKPPCSGTMFYNPDTSCSPTCNPLLRKVTTPINLCLSPCRDPKFYFSLDTERCISECPVGYQTWIITGVKICYSGNQPTWINFTIDNATSETVKANAAIVLSDVSKSIEYGLSVGVPARAMAGTGATTISLQILDKGLFYLRYLKIDYPQNLKNYFLNNQRGIEFHFPLKQPNFILGFGGIDVAQRFKPYIESSSFIDNYWESLIDLVFIILISISLFLILKIVIKYRKEKLREIFSFMYKIFKWNLTLLVFVGTFDDVFFFSGLKYLNMELSMTEDRIDLFISLMSLSVIIIFLGNLLRLIWKYQKLKSKIIPFMDKEIDPHLKERTKYEKMFDHYSVLFEDLKRNKFFNLSFIIFSIIRGIFFYFIVITFGDYPKSQTCLLLASSIIMVGSVIHLRPFSSKVAFFETVALEVIFLLINLMILVLAMIDDNPNMVEEKENIGLVIIVLNTTFTFTALSFTLTHLFLFSRHLWHKIKHRVLGKITLGKFLNLFFKPSPQKIIRKEKRIKTETAHETSKIEHLKHDTPRKSLISLHYEDTGNSTERIQRNDLKLKTQVVLKLKRTRVLNIDIPSSRETSDKDIESLTNFVSPQSEENRKINDSPISLSESPEKLSNSMDIASPFRQLRIRRFSKITGGDRTMSTFAPLTLREVETPGDEIKNPILEDL